MDKPNARVRTVFECRSGHRHEICVAVNRGVPPELRCPDGEAPGYGPAGGGGCAIPPDLDEQVARVLRDDLVGSRRQGFVLVRS